ncbi:MAG TPA: hypothetical protein VK249_21770 [Anaerolineales bacterium]|nr:hypothetical protein [Anaerolineales bacterium]
MKPTSSPQDQEQDQEIIELLKELGSLQVKYPPELLTARRADFVAQVNQQNKIGVGDERPLRKQFVQQLEALQAVKAEYPPELLAARRAAFIAQVEQYTGAAVSEELSSADQEVIRLLQKTKSLEPDYSPEVFAARRSAFIRQIARGGRISLLEALRSSIQDMFRFKLKIPTMPSADFLRTSFVLAALILAAFVGSLLGKPEQLLNLAPTQGEVARPVPVVPTSTGEAEEIICKPGYVPPSCLAKESDHAKNLTFQGNGSARPAVAKDTAPGNSGIHDAAFANDGLYGPGASWISNSRYSWIKIDLGKATTINTVTFGRDRLGYTNDHNPGQFVIAVAMSDNIYADGNSSNDYVEYTQVYDSQQTNFSGIVSGSETVKAQFRPVMARFVKITFVNKGTAIDEVEVYMVQPTGLDEHPTRKPKDDNVPAIAPTIRPANTARPTDTPVPPTATDVPPTEVPPTATDVPPTEMPPTATDVPPTEVPPTEVPPPADTPIPPPDTAEPPAAPTATAAPVVGP